MQLVILSLLLAALVAMLVVTARDMARVRREHFHVRSQNGRLAAPPARLRRARHASPVPPVMAVADHHRRMAA